MIDTTITSENDLVVTLNVGQLREIVRQEVERAVKSHQPGDDRPLNVSEASQLIGMSEDWLYRNAKKLPFTRKMGPKTLRFSHKEIVKWLATRKSS
jgi:predicted DNA-binding transcriptional regulator AlpA